MNKSATKTNLGLILAVGSVWGLTEFAFGMGLQKCATLFTGAILTGIAFFWLSFIWSITRKLLPILMIVGIAIGFKMLDAAFLSDETQQDLYEMRLNLEMGLAESLFTNKTDQGLEELKSVVTRTEKASNEKTRIKLDAEFHRTLYKIAGNNLLYKFQSLLEPFFKTAADREKQGEAKKSEITHRTLLEELDSGTPESFRKAMKEHLAPHFEAMEENR
jgi:hypothetical protein